jgi:hypothetical protein
MIICDEANKIKAAADKASLFFKRLRAHANYRIAMTGTPMPQGDFRDWKVGMLVAQPHPDAMRRVTLLARRLPVGFQHPLDGILQWTDLGLLPFVRLALWRDCVGDCLTHHPSMPAMLLGQSLHRLSGRVASPDLFE